MLTEPSLPPSGLIAASGGNHGATVTFVGRSLGVPVEIYMPSTSPAIKRRTIEQFSVES